MVQRRYSRQRELIYNCVSHTSEHPTAEMVYQWLLPSCPNLSRGTVYRNLNLLSEEGILWRMPFPVERYDARTDPHPHFRCSVCGCVSDLVLPYQSELDELVKKQYDLKVDSHDIIFYGTCKECCDCESNSQDKKE